MFIIRYQKQFLILSGLIIAAAIGILATFGLNMGIDFTGGALTEVAYETERTEKATVEASLNELDLGGYSLRRTVTDAGAEGYVLRTRDLSESERQDVQSALAEGGGSVERFTSVGPVIGEELTRKAQWAMGGVVLIIVLYVAIVFRKVGRPVRSYVYGGITILALAHDVLVPAAVMSLLGYFIGAEVDVLFVMALLAVLGYSVNDTIVVFDRVRENLMKYRQELKRTVKNEYGQDVEEIDYQLTKPFDKIVGESVSQTIVRSVNTSVTTLLAIGALYVFGGQVTQTFALVLMVGVLAGTYSSIFLANPLLVWMSSRPGRHDTVGEPTTAANTNAV